MCSEYRKHQLLKFGKNNNPEINQTINSNKNRLVASQIHFLLFHRWFVVYVPIVRYMRQLLSVSNRGPSPPPILLLSDGGHIENLGILPLLKKRLTKIVVADGGLKTDNSDWGKSLLHAFSLAREKLHCSFIGLDGRDVIEDIKEKFVNTADGFKPRSYR